MSIQHLMSTVAREAISYQVNDAVINKVENVLLEMKEGYLNNGVVKFNNSKEFKSLIKKLEDILSERFNVEFVVGYNLDEGYFSVPAIARSVGYYTHRLDDNNDEHMKEMVAAHKQLQDKKYEERPEDANTNIDNAIFYTGYKEVKFMEELKKEDLLLNVNEVKFVKKPKNYVFYINLDFSKLTGVVPSFKGTTFEIMEGIAIMFHEIGHCWDFVYSLYKIGQDIDILQDIVREEYRKDNRDMPSIVRIFYKKKGIDKKVSDNETQCMIDLQSELYNGATIRGPKRIVMNNIEQQADEFSSRFGLGQYLVTGLSKLASLEYDTTGVLFNCSMISLIGTLISAVTFMANPLLTILMGLMTLFFGGTTYMSLDQSNTYDVLNERYKRVKNSTIRRMKYVTDQRVKDEMIIAVEKIDKKIKELEEQDKSFLRRAVKGIGSILRGNDEEVDFIYMLESLQANDIIVAYEKAKKLRTK